DQCRSPPFLICWQAQRGKVSWLITAYSFSIILLTPTESRSNVCNGLSQSAPQRTQEKHQKKQNANLSDLSMSPIGNSTLNSWRWRAGTSSASDTSGLPSNSLISVSNRAGNSSGT